MQHFVVNALKDIKLETNMDQLLAMHVQQVNLALNQEIIVLVVNVATTSLL